MRLQKSMPVMNGDSARINPESLEPVKAIDEEPQAVDTPLASGPRKDLKHPLSMKQSSQKRTGRRVAPAGSLVSDVAMLFLAEPVYESEAGAEGVLHRRAKASR